MQQTISLTCDTPESGIVLMAVPPPFDFFDTALDDLFTVKGEIQIETLNAAFSMELPLDLDTLSLWLPVPLELCTAVMRQPWMYAG